MVGGQAVEELLGVARQCFTLLVHTDQVGQTHVQADLQRQQEAAATLTLPTGRKALVPVDGLARGWQQGFQAREYGIGALKKGIQSRIHDYSSGKFL